MSELARPNSSLQLQLLDASLPVIGGYGLNLLFNQAPVRCLFDSRQSAVSFHRFCELYVGDAQPGNSYGGFFPPDFLLGSTLPYRVLFPRMGTYFDIFPSTVEQMFHRICQKRIPLDFDYPNPTYAEVSKRWTSGVPLIEKRRGYHLFSFDESLLPPRVAPTQLGQFVSVVDDPLYRRAHAYYIADFGQKALIALFHSNTNPSAEHLVLVDRQHLMLVHDFYEASDLRCQRHEYRAMKERLINYALSRLRYIQQSRLPSP